MLSDGVLCAFGLLRSGHLVSHELMLRDTTVRMAECQVLTVSPLVQAVLCLPPLGSAGDARPIIAWAPDLELLRHGG
jgi:hypothetical protein